MIKINLLGDETIIDTTGTWVVIGYFVSLSVVVLGLLITFFSLAASVSEMQSESQALEKRLQTLQAVTKEVRDLDKKKKELVDKTTIIALLKRSKLGPVHVLDDLNGALPEKSWMTELKEAGGLARISGLALDNQTIANFMKALEGSNYFDRIDIGESKLIPRNGVNIQEFTVQAKVNYAGFNKARLGLSPSASSSPSVSPGALPSISPSASPEASPVSSDSPQATSTGKGE